MALGLFMRQGRAPLPFDVEPLLSTAAEQIMKTTTRATKIRNLRDKVKAGTATAAEKDRLLRLLASHLLSLTDDLDEA